jgi:bifunctional non-homologous end joining protein LigD
MYRGKSLLEVPLHTRRELLLQALADITKDTDSVRLSEAFKDDPNGLIGAAKDLGFEGIIAKRQNSLYAPGKRTGDWLKYKLNKSQEFVIGGYKLDGHLRHSKFVGLREDKDPHEVVREE